MSDVSKKIDESRTGRRRWRRRLTVVTLPMLGVAAIWGWADYRVQRQINAELARIRAAGEPVTMADLRAMYPDPPAEQDTTALWQRAFAAMETIEYVRTKKESERLPFVGFADPPLLPPEPWPELQLAEEYLAKNTHVLDCLHKAARLGGRARFGYGRREPSFWSMYAWSDERDGARACRRMLQLEVNVCTHRNDADGAAQAIHAMFAAGRSLECVPNGIALMKTMICDQAAIEGVARVLPVVDFSDEQFIAIQQSLRSIDYERGYRRAAFERRVRGIHLFREPTSASAYFEEKHELCQHWQPQARGVYDPRNRFVWPVNRRADFATFLRAMRHRMAIYPRPWANGVFKAKRFCQQLERDIDQTTFGRAGHLLTWDLIVFTAFGQGSEYASVASGDAINSLADTAIALHRFHRRYKCLPGKLDELVPVFVPSVPIDSFDDKPLRYRSADRDYLLYSVGRNQQDDGGTNDFGDLISTSDGDITLHGSVRDRNE